MTKTYRNRPFAAIHETMEALYDIEAIDKRTMREFDEACLNPAETVQPEDINAVLHADDS